MGGVKRVKTASGSGRAKRQRGSSPRVSKGASDLRRKIWAVINSGVSVQGNLTHAQAVKLAGKTGGYVTTAEAILRCD